MAMQLLSIQVGRVSEYGRADAADPHDRPWRSAFFKTPIAGSISVDARGVAGDEQADRVNHGTEDKAVLLYAAAHYPLWQSELNIPDMPCGGFGENLTVQGQDESTVCIGDAWLVGPELILQISQPRQPCWKLARRWRCKELPAFVQQNQRSGWYARVIQPGEITAGDELELLARPHAEWSVARAGEVMHLHKQDAALTEALASLPELAASWRSELHQRLEKLRSV